MTSTEPERGPGNTPAVTRAIRILDLLAERAGPDPHPHRDRPRTRPGQVVGVELLRWRWRRVASFAGPAPATCSAGEPWSWVARSCPGSTRSASSTAPARTRRCCAGNWCRSPCWTVRGCLYLAVHEGRERFPLSASVGDRYPASATAVGTALLSELSPERVAELYWDPRESGGIHRTHPPPRWRNCRSSWSAPGTQGYAVDEGEVHSTVLGLAVPVPGGSGEPSFGLGVSIVHPTGSHDERDTILTHCAAPRQLTRPRLLTA